MTTVGAAFDEQAVDQRPAAQIGEFADIAGAERLDQPQQNTAQHGAGEIADAAQHGGGKRLQAEHEAHRVVGDAVIGAIHHAGHGSQARANDEGGGDGAIGVDTHQGCNIHIFGRGADGNAEARAVNKPGEGRHDQHRHQDDGNLHRGD